LLKPIIETTTAGKYEYSSNEIKIISSEIELLNKLIEIEDQLNIKFKFSQDELSRNEFAVELLYYCIKKKKKSFKTRSYWISSFNDPVDENEYKIGTVIRDHCTELSFIELFNERIPLKNIMVSFKEASIVKTTVIENKFSVILSTDYSKLIPKITKNAD